MKKSRRFQLILIGAVLLGAVGLYFDSSSPNQPHYQGRSLSAWLAILDNGEGGDVFLKHQPSPAPTKKQAAAAEAVRQLGTNSLPILIERIKHERVPLHLKILYAPPVAATFSKISPLRRWYQTKMMQPQGDVLAWRAALGIDALGENAAPLIPALSNILAVQPRQAVSASGLTAVAKGKAAARALAGIGAPARPALKRAIASTNQFSSSLAIWALSRRFLDDPEMMSAVISSLESTNRSTQMMAASVLAQAKADPKTVVPLITNLMATAGAGIAERYIYALGEYGPLAKQAVPALLSVTGQDRKSALGALRKIDPEAAANAEAK